MPEVTLDQAGLAALLEGLLAQQSRLQGQIAIVKKLVRGQRVSSADLASLPAGATRKRSRLSANGRHRIAEAQRKRWTEYRRRKKGRAAAAAAS